MASFQTKIGWKRLRSRENKKYRSVSFLLAAYQKIPKKQQKNLKKYQDGFILKQNRLEKGEKERK